MVWMRCYRPAHRTSWPKWSIILTWRGCKSFMKKMSQRQWNCCTPAMWMWISDNIAGSHFWTKFWRASTSLTCPRGYVSTVCHRNTTSWEIIDGRAQWILKGRNVLGSNDRPIKLNPNLRCFARWRQYRYINCKALNSTLKSLRYIEIKIISIVERCFIFRETRVH